MIFDLDLKFPLLNLIVAADLAAEDGMWRNLIQFPDYPGSARFDMQSIVVHGLARYDPGKTSTLLVFEYM